MKTAAILYQPEGFDTRTQRLMGRQATRTLRIADRTVKNLFCSEMRIVATG